MSEVGKPQALVSHRFLVLLGMLILLLLIAPTIVEAGITGGVARITMNLAFSGVLLSSVYAVCTKRRQFVIAVSLLAPLVVLQVVSLFVESDALDEVRLVLALITLTYILALLVIHLFTSTRVTGDTIAAALCVYMLIGVLWSIIYSLIEKVIPGSFRFSYGEDGEVLKGFVGEGSIFSLYYSFVTLSTLGYGDITPMSHPARMFAVVEAIVGQVYLVVLVARLVGIHIAGSHRS